MKNKPILSINNLNKSFKNKKNTINVIDDINLDIYEGEIICIVGTSGCGKTTLLNIISNLYKDYDGKIIYNFNKDDIAYMFQEPALFPWLNVYENAKLGCDIKKIDNYSYINKLLKDYGLYEFKEKFPKDISGGMMQRVALIRTISTSPKLLLLDEPFAALDYQTRLSISNDIYKLVKDNSITTIMITHDISEAISLADRVVVLSKRPCIIKNIYDIKLENKSTPINNRKDKSFTNYYKIIGEDLDIFEST